MSMCVNQMCSGTFLSAEAKYVEQPVSVRLILQNEVRTHKFPAGYGCWAVPGRCLGKVLVGTSQTHTQTVLTVAQTVSL